MKVSQYRKIGSKDLGVSAGCIERERERERERVFI